MNNNSNVMSIKVAASKRSDNVNTMPKFMQEALEDIKYAREKLLGVYNRMYFGEDINNGYKSYTKAIFDENGNLINRYYRVQKGTDDEFEIEFETDENGNYVLEECTLYKWYKLLSDVQTKEDLHQASVQLLIATYQDEVDASISDFEAAVNRAVANNLSELLRAEEEHKLELSSMFEGLTAETTGAIYQAKNNSLDEIATAKSDSVREITGLREDAVETILVTGTEVLAEVENAKNDSVAEISALGADTITSVTNDGLTALTNINDAKSSALESIDSSLENTLTSITDHGADIYTSITTAGMNATTSINSAETNAVTNINTAEENAVNNVSLSKDEAVQYVLETIENQSDTALSQANQAVSDVNDAKDYIDTALEAITSASLGLTFAEFIESDWVEDGNKFYCEIQDISAPMGVFENVDGNKEYRLGVDMLINSEGVTTIRSYNKFNGFVLGTGNLIEYTGEDEDNNEFTEEELEAAVISDWINV